MKQTSHRYLNSTSNQHWNPKHTTRKQKWFNLQLVHLEDLFKNLPTTHLENSSIDKKKERQKKKKETNLEKKRKILTQTKCAKINNGLVCARGLVAQTTGREEGGSGRACKVFLEWLLHKHSEAYRTETLQITADGAPPAKCNFTYALKTRCFPLSLLRWIVPSVTLPLVFWCGSPLPLKVLPSVVSSQWIFFKCFRWVFPLV